MYISTNGATLMVQAKNGGAVDVATVKGEDEFVVGFDMGLEAINAEMSAMVGKARLLRLLRVAWGDAGIKHLVLPCDHVWLTLGCEGLLLFFRGADGADRLEQAKKILMDKCLTVEHIPASGTCAGEPSSGYWRFDFRAGSGITLVEPRVKTDVDTGTSGEV